MVLQRTTSQNESEPSMYEEFDEIVDAIIFDISDRRGLKHKWDQIDDDVQNEIKEAWKQILFKHDFPIPNNSNRLTTQVRLKWGAVIIVAAAFFISIVGILNGQGFAKMFFASLSIISLLSFATGAIIHIIPPASDD